MWVLYARHGNISADVIIDSHKMHFIVIKRPRIERILRQGLLLLLAMQYVLLRVDLKLICKKNIRSQVSYVYKVIRLNVEASRL